MKKGNVEIIEIDGGYRILNKRDNFGRAFWISEQDLKDLHTLLSELLETHTVKEEKEILLGEDKSDGVHVKLFGYRKDGGVYVTREEVKEEPTTPEIIITGLQYKMVSQPTTPEKIYCGKVTHPFFCECKPTIPEKKHGKGLCTTYHPDDCCTMNPKCDFYEPPKPTTPEKKCCEKRNDIY